jgi:Zn-dependent M28 family amino/carboxypeptidase
MRVRRVLAAGVVVVAVTVVWTADTAAGPAFSGARAFAHLKAVVGFGPRPAGSPAIERTRAYIRQQLALIGLTATEQAFDARTPVGRIRMVNLRVTFPGTGKGRLVIAGHYDTKIFRDIRFVGANDAGSSTAFLLELARALKGRTNTIPIELVFFDGEEAVIEWRGTDRVYGSRHYVDTARASGDLASIKAMILVDMIGDRDLNLRRESTSTKWLTDAVWNSARTLGLGRHFLDEEMPIEDDHVPFLEAGIPAVDLIDFDYPPWHTAGDTLDQVSAGSLEIVGTVLLDALPAIERRLSPTAGAGR